MKVCASMFEITFVDKNVIVLTIFFLMEYLDQILNKKQSIRTEILSVPQEAGWKNAKCTILVKMWLLKKNL